MEDASGTVRGVEVERCEHGRPSWVDLTTTDVTSSSEFYGGLFGWDTPPGPPESGGYVVATIGGKPVAGISPKMNPAAPSAWTTYVNVGDADAAAAAVPAAGGQVVVAPMDVLESGRLAVVADPTGAVVGVWQPRQHLGARLVNEPNTWVWSQLFTTDAEAAGSFYRQVFGWDLAEAEVGHSFSVGGNPIAGIVPKPVEMPADVPPHWHVYFSVEDAGAAVGRVRELGGELVFGPVPMPYGPMATVVDPAGVAFSVVGTGQPG
jgi:predicted enzyme related to lactoylglutathione lyase